MFPLPVPTFIGNGRGHNGTKEGVSGLPAPFGPHLPGRPEKQWWLLPQAPSPPLLLSNGGPTSNRMRRQQETRQATAWARKATEVVHDRSDGSSERDRTGGQKRVPSRDQQEGFTVMVR